MSATHLPAQDVNQILETFAHFFERTVDEHPKKNQMLMQMHSFLGFLSENRDDLSKGYEFLREMKNGRESREEKKIDVIIQNLKKIESEQFHTKEINEYEYSQEMKMINWDNKCFSYDLLLLLVSVRYWDLLLGFIDLNKLNLLYIIKEKVFHDTLSQNVQEKIIQFFERIEEVNKTERMGFKKAFLKVITTERSNEFLIAMVPVIKQIIIKFLINSEWNFVREKLQDKLNTNSLNQIFTLFKNQANFPQKETNLHHMDENMQNFLQILALGLNINIRIIWNNDNEFLSKSFSCKSKEECLGIVSVLITKQNNNWLYYNLFMPNELSEFSDTNTLVIKKSNEIEKFDSVKHFNNFSKSTSIKISDDMFPLNTNFPNQKPSQEDPNYNQNSKKKSIFKPNYLIDFLANFQEKTEEIYGKIFEDNVVNDASKKVGIKRFLSSELEASDDVHTPFSNTRKTEVASAGVKSQTNTNKQMGFIQKCTKCPKEYVEYETKKDNNYLCYICR